RNPNSLIYNFVFRNFDPGQKMTLTSEEIASLYHFPISSTEAPRVKWLKFKESSPPSELPKSGLLIGESVFRGEKKEIRITDDDRRRHIYIIGQTGTGKTGLISNCVREDIKNGKGLAIIDPHGDLAEGALSQVPKERMEDVIYFDPGDLSRPMGLNMLDFNFEKPEEKTFIVNEMQSIFDKLFDQESMGPMFQQYMRNALLLLMEDMPNEPATLVEVPRIFTDAEFRKRKLARIKNPVVIDFWEKEAAKAGGDASLANMTPYITSKFGNFISNDYLRPIIGQTKSAFNFREVMDSGKILIINLSKGKIGDINANLLGMVFAGKLLMAALSRGDIEQEKRKDFYLYIDEFQNFTTDSISTILSEARKYRLNLTVAHQFIAQLTEKIRDSIFGNVGAQLVLRVGVQDAEFLVKQFDPVFDVNDLINIQNFNAYAKILVNGQPAKPFNFMIPKPTQGDRIQVDRLKEFSRAKYGMDREKIEAEIYKRLRE
ncbi:MAG: type IV secretion system DNA-binding domain-containing protein, partial [Candidatus Liptonbacteria bacterium]|nr:type IV secretion system DNA-binding domain-containing protein [Candidatus Liptonbacteria bacterium]